MKISLKTKPDAVAVLLRRLQRKIHDFRIVTLAMGLVMMVAAQAQNLYFLDAASGSSYQITPSATVSQFPGSGGSGTGYPIPIAVDSVGNLFQFPVGNGTIVRVNPSGVKTTFATGLGFVSDAQFDVFGNLFVTDRNAIIKFTPAGVKSTFATLGNLNLASDGAGNIYTIAGGTDLVKFTPGGVRSTIATGFAPANGFYGLATDSKGNIFVADSINSSIIEVTPTGTKSTFATGLAPGIFDGLAIDRSDNLFVGNAFTGAITKFSPSGVQTTFLNRGFQQESLTFGPPSVIPEPSTILFGIASSLAGLLTKRRGGRPRRLS